MNNSSPVSINLPGYIQQQPLQISTPDGDSPNKGESVIYKIPPAAWIFIFLLIGYLGMRYVMED